MKNYREEWTIVINRHKYVLNEERANIVKKMISEGKGGMIMFDDFVINIPFIQEFYLSNKIYDVNKKLAVSEKEISLEEKKRITIKLAELKEKLFKKTSF